MKKQFKWMLILLLLCTQIYAYGQGNINITGKVLDGISNEPLIGVSVVVKGKESKLATITNVDGVFNLKVDSQSDVLAFSYIGYKEQLATVGAQTSFKIMMQEDAQALEQVVVVGYGTQTKSSITGAISNISSDDIIRTASVTTSGTLVGKVAGISARQTDGRPGASTNIQIRNLGSPLYVIDGMPSDEGHFNNLSSNDIESISVLKDGSAAIYGVRAANGVVLVTTKSGARNTKNTINATAYFGIQNMSRYPKPAGAYDYVRALMESDLNKHGGTANTMEDLEYWKSNGEDYYNAIISKNAPIYHFNINASGGSEKSSYYLSLSHIDQDAVFKGYSFKRTNLQANFDIDLVKGLKVGTKTNGRIETRNNVSVPGMNQDNYWGPYFAMFLNKPTESMYANNNPDFINQTSGGSWNPASFHRDIAGYTDDVWKVLQTSLFAEYDIPIEGLKAKGTMSYWYANNNEDRHEYSWDAYRYDKDSDSYISNNGSSNAGWKRRRYENRDELTWQFQLNYQNRFGLHNVGALAVSEVNDSKRKFYQIQGNPSNNILYPLDLDEMNYMEDTSTRFRKASLIYRLNYDYDNKYYVETAGRYDGSSLFQDGSRWGFFPSVSVGWRLSEEAFMEEIKQNWLTNFKLRASFGQTGDDKNLNNSWIVAPHAYHEGYNWKQGTSVLGDKTLSGIASRGLPTTTITWMKSTMYNVGFDADFLDGRLNSTFDLFYRKRSGIPATGVHLLIPTEVGFEAPQQNLNSDSHRGVEFTLNWNDKIDQVRYKVGGNATISRRKMGHYDADATLGSSWNKYRNGLGNRWADILWGYEVIGQFQNQEQIQNYEIDLDGKGNSTLLPGDLIYKDTNNDGIIDALDERPIGYAQGALPYVNFALNLQVEWNNFDLKADFTGASMQSYMRQFELRAPLLGNNNSPSYLFKDAWHHADPTDANSAWVAGKYPSIRSDQLAHSNYNRASTFWMTNINYIKLRTLEVGYTIPKKLTSRYHINDLRFYANCYNLFSLDNVSDYGIDPELGIDTGLGSPTVRTFNFGVNLTF